jgi:hypothetical protein
VHRRERRERAILLTHVALTNHPVSEDHVAAVCEGVELVERVEVLPPLRGELDDFDDRYPWDEALAQQRVGHRHLREAMAAHAGARVIYMGFAPIPLVLHLGRLLGDFAPVDVFQYHHESGSWLWPSAELTPNLIAPPSLPPANSSSERAVLLRVSASYSVTAQDVAWIPGADMHDCALELSQVRPGALRSRADVRAFALRFRQLLDDVHERFPAAPTTHLAASVPVGAALAMGMQIKPTVHLPIQTWKYLSQRRRRYVKAAHLGVFVDLPKALLLAASPVDQRATTATQEVQSLTDLLAKHERRLTFASRPAVGVDSLSLLLAHLDPSVVHIACHGHELAHGGQLQLESSDGWTIPVGTEDLARLLTRAPSLRCVILTACKSAELARALTADIPAAIGWVDAVPDYEARSFAEALWRSLVAGYSIAEAFADARLTITPPRRECVVLALRAGVSADTLILFPKD